MTQVLVRGEQRVHWLVLPNNPPALRLRERPRHTIPVAALESIGAHLFRFCRLKRSESPTNALLQPLLILMFARSADPADFWPVLTPLYHPRSSASIRVRVSLVMESYSLVTNVEVTRRFFGIEPHTVR